MTVSLAHDSLFSIRGPIHYKSGEPSRIDAPPSVERSLGTVAFALRQYSAMYLAGLEKILKDGQALGLAGAELREYFDTEYAKLRAERALNREAMRLGVDAVRLAACGEDSDAILNECEKQKNAYERDPSSLNKEVAALESPARPVRTEGMSLA